MRIIDGTAADLSRFGDLLARANDAPYDLSIVAEEKCLGDGLAGKPRFRIAVTDQTAVGFSVTCGRFLRLLAVDRGQRRRGIGTLLLRDAEQNAGPYSDSLTVGAEPGNYFIPGVPLEDQATLGFFARHGYRAVGDLAINMSVALEDLTVSETPLPPGVVVDFPLPSEQEHVLRFIGTEFGPGWELEVSRAIQNSPPRVVIASNHDGIAGFAAWDGNNRGLGWFGPAGVTTSARGSGLGGRMLRRALAELHHLGYKEAVVPWVSSVDYYRRACGAGISGSFVRLRRSLTDRRS
ncbi:MAG TPA: GNAT family N-acetyltransferase [Thermoanaerobaculia bacterium]|nr:GNAT family N-acetyltransferase [Thermoanaerobaculia bacterium]